MLGFEHAQKNARLRKVFGILLRIIRSPPDQAVQTGKNGSHQLVRITCCDRAFGLALDDQLPEHSLQFLTPPVYQLTEMVRNCLRTEDLTHKLIGLRMPSTFHEP